MHVHESEEKNFYLFMFLITVENSTYRNLLLGKQTNKQMYSNLI